MPGSRKAERKLNDRRKGYQDYGKGKEEVRFGMVADGNGKLQMLHKPGSQNRNK